MSTHRAESYKTNLERLASGDVAKVAEVVVDLVGRDLNVGLTVGEKRMLAKARQVFASEMAVAAERWTSCTCNDGHHFDPKAITRSHRLRLDAEIIARHTGRHVVPVSDIQTEVAA